MDPGPNLIGLEFVVGDLDAAVRFCVDVLGLALVDRRPSDDVDGEVAVVALGNAALTLLQPTAGHGRPVLNRREPRLSQIFLGIAPDDLAPFAERIVAAGVPVHVAEEHRFFVPATTIDAVLGIATTVTVLGVADVADAADAPAAR